MPGHHLALVQDADLMTIGANRDRLARQVRRHRVVVRVELDPREWTDDSRHDLVGVEGDSGQCAQQRTLLLETVYRPFSSRLMRPDVGNLVAPPGCERNVVLEADELVTTTGQSIVFHITHTRLDGSF